MKRFGLPVACLISLSAYPEVRGKCEATLSGREEVTACVRTVISDLLAKTSFSDATNIDVVRTPLLGSRYSFNASDSNGNTFSGSVRVKVRDFVRRDLRTGEELSRSLKCDFIDKEIITGPAFVLKNRRGMVAYKIKGQPSVSAGC